MPKSLPTGKQANVKLPAGASRKRYIVLIVPLDPAYMAGVAGHLPAKGMSKFKMFFHLALGLHLNLEG